MTEEQEVILQEAISRGYGPGVKVNSLGGNHNYIITTASFDWYFPQTRLLRACGNCIIYDNGRWAPILNSPVVNNNYPIY